LADGFRDHPAGLWRKAPEGRSKLPLLVTFVHDFHSNVADDRIRKDIAEADPISSAIRSWYSFVASCPGRDLELKTASLSMLEAVQSKDIARPITLLPQCCRSPKQRLCGFHRLPPDTTVLTFLLSPQNFWFSN